MENTICRNTIFRILSQIPLDIEGSNISKTGWYPSEYDNEWMKESSIIEANKEAEKKDEKVLFNNVYLEYDSCDCNDGMCSHGSWVWQIIVLDKEKRFEIELDEDFMLADNGKRAGIPLECTVYDFYRMCEIVGIELEFTDYAKSLFNS